MADSKQKSSVIFDRKVKCNLAYWNRFVAVFAWSVANDNSA